MKQPSAHCHTLVLARCTRDPDAEDLADQLRDFLPRLARELDMHILIKEQVLYGKFGYTGIAGIVTSHIAFHYFEYGRILQFDVYSCKHYALDKLLTVLDDFFGIERAEVLFIDREDALAVTPYVFENSTLRRSDLSEHNAKWTI